MPPLGQEGPVLLGPLPLDHSSWCLAGAHCRHCNVRRPCQSLHLHQRRKRLRRLILLQKEVMQNLRIPQVNNSLGKAQAEYSASMAGHAKTRNARTLIQMDEGLMKILIAQFAASEGNVKGRVASLSTHKAAKWMMILRKVCAAKVLAVSGLIAFIPTRKGE